MDRRRDLKTYLANAAAYQEFVELLSSFGGSLAGKSVLEAGVAPVPDFIAQIDRTFPLKEAVGINLVVDQTTHYSPSLRVERGDLRKIGYPNDRFDWVVSSAVFEHVHNFDVALAEMYRVLRSGGLLFSHFGPIWSGSYGHHLWYNQVTTYHTLRLPPHCHLLMTLPELEEWLRDRQHPLASEIARYVFTSDEQNQLMYSDYDRIVSESGFERLFFKGYDHPTLQHRYMLGTSADHYSALNTRYPADKDRFLYDGITMLLRKPL